MHYFSNVKVSSPYTESKVKVTLPYTGYNNLSSVDSKTSCNTNSSSLLDIGRCEKATVNQYLFMEHVRQRST